MRKLIFPLALTAIACLAPTLVHADDDHRKARNAASVQLGPRPFFLVNDMQDSPLKTRLQACTQRDEFKKSDFSIGHRGAALQFPEHTERVV